ncbi:MAG: hypothetical protein CL607_04435 [Anaerolineaceae bacterium]|nr:hypothetical protein [Anaerolineaceae bacterium]
MSDWRKAAKIGLTAADMWWQINGHPLGELPDAYSHLESQQHDQNTAQMTELRDAIQSESDRPAEYRDYEDESGDHIDTVDLSFTDEDEALFAEVEAAIEDQSSLSEQKDE